MSIACPPHWELIALGDYMEVSRGASPRPKGDPRYFGGDIPWISIRDVNAEKGKFLSKTAEGVTPAGAQKSRLVQPGGLILSNSASVCIPKILKVQGCIHDGFVTFPDIKENFDTSYLYYYFDWLRPSVIEKHKQGVTQVNLNTEIIKSFEVPTPPLAEQTRIAQKLDELLAQVDTLKARIDAISALLKRFRQSVLAAAVSGRLTGEWREQSEILPTKQVGELFEIVSGPAFKKEQYAAEGSRLLQIANVGYGCTVWETVNYIPMSLASLEKKFELRAGDIVMALNRPITNGTLKVAQIDNRDLPATLYQRVARFRQKTSGPLNIEYIFLCFRNESFRKQVQKELQGSDQPYINTSSLNKLKINFPQFSEQAEIVRRVEQLFSFADQLEAKVASAKSRIDHLTQSILAKAFRGELVPQDPNDEPASVLLQRIQAQRAAAPKAKRGRKSA